MFIRDFSKSTAPFIEEALQVPINKFSGAGTSSSHTFFATGAAGT
jgi:hypothetical protein